MQPLVKGTNETEYAQQPESPHLQPQAPITVENPFPCAGMSVAAVVIVAVVVTVAVVIVVVVERTGTLPVSRHSALPSCPVR